LCRESSRRYQQRKGRQWQSAFGQQNGEKNKQRAIPLDVGRELLHRLSACLKALGYEVRLSG
jgi:hypothetical protein